MMVLRSRRPSRSSNAESKQGIHPARTKRKGEMGVAPGLACIGAFVVVLLASPTHHPAWQSGQAQIAAEGGAGRRSAKIAAAPLNQSREVHHTGRPLHSPEGGRG
jgi:hypothetical protein